MDKPTDNIELRSEKARKTIGQIPPIIVRIGIIIMTFIIIILLLGAYYIKFDYSIKTKGLIEQKKDSTIIIIKVPVNEIYNIKNGQKVILSFNKIPRIYDLKLLIEIPTVYNTMHISSSGAYYYTKITFSNKELFIKNFKFILDDKIELNAVISLGKISVYEWISKRL